MQRGNVIENSYLDEMVLGVSPDPIASPLITKLDPADNPLR